MKKSALYCHVILFAAAIFTYQTAYTQNYTYQELFRITNDESEDGLIVNSPKFLVIGEENHLYVGDWQLSQIHKFDSNGQLINKFGERGGGPGEFTEVSTLFFDPSDQTIAVYDRTALRLTKFTTDGEPAGTFPFSGEKIVSPWMGRANSKGEIFLLYRDSPYPNEPTPEIDDLIHVFNPEFTEETTSFVEREMFGDIHNVPFLNGLVGGSSTGFFELLNDQEIIVLPYIYAGKLYHYERTNTGEWVLKQELEGDTISDLHAEQVDYNRAPEHARRMGTPQGPIAGIIYSESTGICILDNERLAVFGYQRGKDYIGEFGYSLFNYQNGEFLGYERIEEYSPTSLEMRHPVLNIGCDQTLNRIYFVDYTSDEPEIVAAEIEFNLP